MCTSKSEVSNLIDDGKIHSMDKKDTYGLRDPFDSSDYSLESPCIMITCPYDLEPLTPHFYIVKLGFTGVYIIFSLL